MAAVCDNHYQDNSVQAPIWMLFVCVFTWDIWELGYTMLRLGNFCVYLDVLFAEWGSIDNEFFVYQHFIY